tara:strand:+ start:386 stop:604 length:219 start_codon:yes stop_codon:yes gene_type:complete
MGRAIEMEKHLDEMSSRLKSVEDALARVIDIVDGMEEKAIKLKPAKKTKSKKEKLDVSKEKANNETDGESDK